MSASIYTLLVIYNPTVSNVRLLLIQCTINNHYSENLKIITWKPEIQEKKAVHVRTNHGQTTLK
jgi:hypothetical protein